MSHLPKTCEMLGCDPAAPFHAMVGAQEARRLTEAERALLNGNLIWNAGVPSMALEAVIEKIIADRLADSRRAQEAAFDAGFYLGIDAPLVSRKDYNAKRAAFLEGLS